MPTKINEITIRPNRKSGARTRIYIFPEKETLIDNLQNRRTRPHKVWQKDLFPAAFEKLNLPEATTIRWSQKAGCRCGCSPGFIVENNWGWEIFLDVESE